MIDLKEALQTAFKDKANLEPITDTLESIVDQFGMVITLNLLAKICEGKADHIRENWQDEGLATRWQRRADLIERLAAKIQNEKTRF